MLRSLCAALALALLACSSSSTPVPDAGAPDTCSSDAECSTGFKCDREQRRCVCTGDAACPGGFCNAFTGQCVASVPGCTSDSACGSGQFCDSSVRTCKPLTALCGTCKTDAQCGANSRCAAHPSYPSQGTFCVPKCATTDAGGQCANGLKCLPRDATPNAEQLCYPASGACGVSNACTPDSRKPCNADGDCNDTGQVCDATLKWCVAKVRACPAGDACDPQQLICVPACTSDNDCLTIIEHKPGYKCVANACILQALCNSDADCSNGSNCQQNADGSKTCVAGCVQNGDCPLGQSCSKTDPNHPKCVQGCTVDSDCPLNNICSGGSCSATSNGRQACQDTQVCPIASRCDKSTESCIAGDLTTNNTTGLCVPSSSVCINQCTASGCPPNDCTRSCFQFSLGACPGGQTTCDQKWPGTKCTSLGQCQVMMHLQGCTPGDGTTCQWKGFSCYAASIFCSGASGGACLPNTQAAQVACLQGHP
jgi:hypothetical protein